jgi:hypothetical protein
MFDSPEVEHYDSGSKGRRRLADDDESPAKSKFLDLVYWMERYGFEGADPDGMGENIFTGSLSFAGFFNHACNHKPAVKYLQAEYHDILVGGTWDPFNYIYRTELAFLETFVRDGKRDKS